FWEGHFRNAGFTHGMTTSGRHGGDGLTIGRETLQPIADFLDHTAKGRAFFLWYAPMLPHKPHTPPERFQARYRDRKLPVRARDYYATISWFDETVGRLLELLSARGLLDRTLVAFVVDNGWVPRRDESRRSAVGSKNTPFEAGVRTPVILFWPGRIRPAIHDDLVSTVDIMPTLLEAAGVAVPEGQPGVSLLPVAKGEKRKLERDAVFGEIYWHTARAVRPPSVNLLFRWIRQGTWKLIVPESPSRGGPRLYDLAQDRSETRNLADRPELRERLQSMRRRLDAWWRPADATVTAPVH
ncbi:MAG: sulfatase-like hydrolase/transferase, partial [Candidatus Binatia bacterium]